MTIHSATTGGAGSSDSSGRSFDKIIRHGGRNFHATTTMATIFAARAEDVIARRDTELVPLLHRDGVELLLVAPNTVFVVVDAGIGLGGRPPRP